MGFTNELLKLAREDTRPLILVIQTIMQLPTSFGPYFAGLIAEKINFLRSSSSCWPAA